MYLNIIMKLKNRTRSTPILENLNLTRESRLNPPTATKMNWIPNYKEQNRGFNFYNKEFRNKRFTVQPINKRFYNEKFLGIGARGRQRNDLEGESVKRADGYGKLKKERPEQLIELDEIAVVEKRQMNFEGAPLKGYRITNRQEAVRYINEFGGKRKYNRGGKVSRQSGLYGGGYMMRAYEQAQIKQSSNDFVVEADEFKNLADMVLQAQDPNNKIKEKTSPEGV